jgi:uncharacterized protein (TIGR03790 family)
MMQVIKCFAFFDRGGRPAVFCFFLLALLTIIKTMKRIMTYIFVLSIIPAFMLAVTGRAEAFLSPDEIVVIVNAGSDDSVRLGELYVKLRKVPAVHLVRVNAAMRANEHMTRKEYEEDIAEPLRTAIEQLNKGGKNIRCLVTTYGIPLAISPVSNPDTTADAVKKHREKLKWKGEEIERLTKLAAESNNSGQPSQKVINRIKGERSKLQFELDHMLGNDTSAAVDSELALLLSPGYPIAMTQPNPEFIYNRGGGSGLRPVLMVSRLDAPTPELAADMIRTAIDVEREGLKGKFYLDARGITENNDYGTVDEDIRRTAKLMQKSPFPVVLDDKPKLFSEAPDAALYCGWYSLGKYRDVFQWSKGAVGYHIASSEAVSLHDPKKNYWVKSMIERGVIASIGPVGEPYLMAFPRPSLFFQLLMSGRYTLAEVFAMSNPFLSWRMILVGDPLYNPFKKRPAYPLKDPPSPPM